MEKRNPGSDGEDHRFLSVDREHVSAVGESGVHRGGRVLARTPSRFACRRVSEQFDGAVLKPTNGASSWLN
jgi:hypothetical protein